MRTKKFPWPNSSGAWLVANPGKYIPIFSEDVVAPLVQLSRGKQRQVFPWPSNSPATPLCAATIPSLTETAAIWITFLTGDFVFGYWLDHAAREVRIVDIEDAS